MNDKEMILAIDRAAFNQGKNAKYDFSVTGGGIAQTVIAKGPGAVCYRRSVRSVQQTTNFRNNNKSNRERW